MSPIRGWNLGEVELIDDVRVVKAPAAEELDLSFFPSLSPRDLEHIHKREYWLAYECEEPRGEAELEAAKDRVRRLPIRFRVAGDQVIISAEEDSHQRMAIRT